MPYFPIYLPIHLPIYRQNKSVTLSLQNFPQGGFLHFLSVLLIVSYALQYNRFLCGALT